MEFRGTDGGYLGTFTLCAMTNCKKMLYTPPVGLDISIIPRNNYGRINLYWI